MSDTPRTDAVQVYGGDITVCDIDVVPAEFARQLERELRLYELLAKDLKSILGRWKN